jgi:hypothetical protein
MNSICKPIIIHYQQECRLWETKDQTKSLGFLTMCCRLYIPLINLACIIVCFLGENDSWLHMCHCGARADNLTRI